MTIPGVLAAWSLSLWRSVNADDLAAAAVLVAPNLARIGDTPEIKPVDVTEAATVGLARGVALR